MMIRSATAADLAAVAAIYAHYVATSVATFDEVAPEAAFWSGRLRELDERGLPFLVAEEEGEVAGYALASQWRPKPAYRHTVEDSIYLAPGRTGRGLGRALLGELLPRCAKGGIRQVVAVIADTGEPGSAALHRAFGFEAAGRLKGVGFKLGRWVDTELMQLDLTR
ncbi:GNAT family N-acetyltransferase [Nonomuraea africana]|uniref:Phosphinothricin acetyltransferase n=1 Tax=Nonomuraea africana TaxID=46171 RepID=A0ABR9KEZ1_9ACTN|nr:GNAT family N-acetyltransferase [Nonomuraea africana]MBE1560549.1 phosphinothricin acetyltransferase [Nonomuraea africana]